MSSSAEASSAGPVRRLGWLATAAAVSVLGACSVLSGSQGDPAVPVLIRGTVVDGGGARLAGAGVQLEVRDPGHHRVGEPDPLVYHGTFTAGLDGAFEIHVLPTPALIALSRRDSGWVNFAVVVTAVDGTPVSSFEFGRQIGDGDWIGDVPDLAIGPNRLDRRRPGAS